MISNGEDDAIRRSSKYQGQPLNPPSTEPALALHNPDRGFSHYLSLRSSCALSDFSMVVVAASSVPMNLESLVNENGEETMAPPAKKQRFCDEMNRVAEIVLVLSALGRMRGGKNPSELEFELMVEARSKSNILFAK
ncbi:unnamed protein product [Microthlaspi erraticum]|uniref:DUF7797 domain-containing protein n=1 Tax=Microthlaspi erraticum TaxID=1685480 RepID=A0A6D2KCU9_9BRAS|nr:unnamed protein product [Microthlaspi erraticum]